MAYPVLQYLNSYTKNIPLPGVQACVDPSACKLRVEGAGDVKVRPDEAIVFLGVVTENKQLSAAQEENSVRMTAVIKTLMDMGIPAEDIQTQSYNIAPQYDYIDGKQVFRGYRVDNMLQVIIREMNRIGEIIDAAVQSGANEVGSITFAVSNPSLYYQDALDAAVDDALAKVRTLAVKLNIQVSPVPVQIVEKGYEAVPPVTPMMYQASAPSTPIQTGMIEITARIEAVFAYRPRS